MTHLESTVAELVGEAKMKEYTTKIEEMEKNYTDFLGAADHGLAIAICELGKFFEGLPKETLQSTMGDQMEVIAKAVIHTETIVSGLIDLHKAIYPTIKIKDLYRKKLMKEVSDAKEACEALRLLVRKV